MTDNQSRLAFEKWASNDGEWKAAIERNDHGGYKLMQTQLYWNAWQAAMQSVTPAPDVPTEEMIEAFETEKSQWGTRCNKMNGGDRQHEVFRHEEADTVSPIVVSRHHTHEEAVNVMREEAWRAGYKAMLAAAPAQPSAEVDLVAIIDDRISIYRNKIKNEIQSKESNAELRFAIDALKHVRSEVDAYLNQHKGK